MIRVITLNDIERILSEKKITYYETSSLGKIVNQGVCIDELDVFLLFVQDQKIPFVMCAETYIEAGEFIITDDLVEKVLYNIPKGALQEIGDAIKGYNKSVQAVDFDFPKWIVVACVYAGCYFYTLFWNQFYIDNVEIENPKEALSRIVQEHSETLEKAKKGHRDEIERLKKELAEFVLADPDFCLQTNQRLRREYIINVFASKLDDHFLLLKKHWYRDEFRSVWQGAIDFVELLWREEKMRK